MNKFLEYQRICVLSSLRNSGTKKYKDIEKNKNQFGEIRVFTKKKLGGGDG